MSYGFRNVSDSVRWCQEGVTWSQESVRWKVSELPPEISTLTPFRIQGGWSEPDRGRTVRRHPSAKNRIHLVQLIFSWPFIPLSEVRTPFLRSRFFNISICWNRDTCFAPPASGS